MSYNIIRQHTARTLNRLDPVADRNVERVVSYVYTHTALNVLPRVTSVSQAKMLQQKIQGPLDTLPT